MPATDEPHLREAIALAAAAGERGDPPFGSLLVGPGGDVLARETNTTQTTKDLSAHPELRLAVWAGRELTTDEAASCTMYTSCEPCSMCLAGIERSGVHRVVYALSAAQLRSLRPVRPTRAVTLEGPHLFSEARALMDEFDTW